MEYKHYYKGFTLFEKIALLLNKKKYNFKLKKEFLNKNEKNFKNTIFVGNHVGNITIQSNVFFIFKGSITGNLILEKDSKIAFFGQVFGVVNSEQELLLRKGSNVYGKLFALKLKIENGARINARIILKDNNWF